MTQSTRSFECSGYWWIDDHQEAKVAGILKYDPQEGGLLEVFGSLTRPDTDRFSLIRGHSSEGDFVTLVDCYRTETNFKGSITTHKIVCRISLVGNYYPPSNLEFSKSALRFAGLDKWVHFKSIVLDRGGADKELVFKIGYGPQGTLSCDDPDIRSTIESDYEYKGSGNSVDLQTYISVYTESSADCSLKWHTEQVLLVRDLASLCMGLPAPINYLALYGAKKTLAREIEIDEKVSVFFVERQPAAAMASSYPLVSFARVVKEQPNILNSWFSLRFKYRDVIDLLSIISNGLSEKPEINFLLMAQAFEAYDRAAFPRKLVSDESFKLAHDAMTAAIPPGTDNDLRQKLKAAIKYANEPSLRKRFKELHSRLSEQVGAEPFGFRSTSIAKLVDTRNYYTHYPSDMQTPIFSASEMMIETERFCLILTCSILSELGLDIKATAARAAMHPRFGSFSAFTIPPDRNASQASSSDPSVHGSHAQSEGGNTTEAPQKESE